MDSFRAICNGGLDLQVLAGAEMSLKGTQVSPNQKQPSLMSSPAKAALPGAPATSSRLMRNSSSLRAKAWQTWWGTPLT